MISLEHVIDLGGDRADLDLGVDEAGRSHDEFGDLAFGVLQFIRPGRGGHEDRARRSALPFLELQRPVVERGRQPETEFDQRFLARPVALVHRAYLGHGHVRFVDHQQRIGRQVIEQARWRLAGHVASEVARVVLDAIAVADLGQHLQIELGALRQALRFDQLVLGVQLLQALAQFLLDGGKRVQHGAARSDVVRSRIDRVARQLAQGLARERVEHGEVFDLAVEQLDAQRLCIAFGRVYVDHFTTHAIGRATQLGVVAGVLHLRKSPDQLALLDALATHHVQHHLEVLVRVAQAIDRRHRAYDQGVLALQQRLGRRQAHLLDVLVHRAVLLDVGIGGRDVGLGLVVVVVADEVLDRVVREEGLELAVQLRRQRLVRRHHDRRLLHLLDDVGDGEGLAGTGDAQQRLVREPVLKTVDQFRDRLRLVAGWLIRGCQLEMPRRDGSVRSSAYGVG